MRAMPEALIAAKTLRSARLLLRAPDVAMAEAAADFFKRNREHFAPWDPPTPPAFHDPETQRDRLAKGAQAFDEGLAFRYWVSLADEPQRLVASVNVSSIVRGAFHNGMLGYSLDAQQQGRGLMTEALREVIAEMFGSRVNLHRLQANYRPDNLRSAAVLQRLGFREEGLAREYLFIDGAWRDHVMTALTNPHFEGVPLF